MNPEVCRGAIVIFYKNIDGQRHYLVQEGKTGKVSFIAGAREPEDSDSAIKNAQREIQEEIGLNPEQYELQLTLVKHKFVFGEHKRDRAGNPGEYDVLIADVTHMLDIRATDEIKSVKWLTKKEVLDSLSFDDLKEVFKEVIKEVKI